MDTELAKSGPGKAKVVLMWHGVPSEDIADDICATGISSRVSGADRGYFGKGVYLTPEAAYAAYYANKQQPPKRGNTYTLLLCAVCIANPYPVTRGADYINGAVDAADAAATASGGGVSRFHYTCGRPGTAIGLYKGFDAHFVAINISEQWQAATNVADPDFHELVVGEDQVLPFAKVVVKIK